MASVERHAEISEIFLEHADDLFRAGDSIQASEKAWGAVAHCLKSIALRRNWPSGSHQALKVIVERLAEESYDPGRIVTLYKSAESLHSNFYEDRLADEVVGRYIGNVKELIAILQEIA